MSLVAFTLPVQSSLSFLFVIGGSCTSGLGGGADGGPSFLPFFHPSFFPSKNRAWRMLVQHQGESGGNSRRFRWLCFSFLLMDGGVGGGGAHGWRHRTGSGIFAATLKTAHVGTFGPPRTRKRLRGRTGCFPDSTLHGCSCHSNSYRVPFRRHSSSGAAHAEPQSWVGLAYMKRVYTADERGTSGP